MSVNYIAKQPVLDAELNVWGHELLFRSGPENKYVEGRDPDSMDRATMSVMENALYNHICTEGGNTKNLINFTRNLLVGEYVHMLPVQYVIVELLEDIYPDEEVIEACTKLKELGYTIALDDFVYDESYEKLLHLADIVKIDFMASNKESRREIADRLRRYNVILLAEKIENIVDFEEAKDLGCRYFQGYFFSEPKMIEKDKLYESKLSKLKLIHEIHSKGFNIENIEEILKTDPVLTFRLLKYVNSAFFSFRSDITNLRQAIMILGEKKLKRWITVIATAALSEDKPFDLIQDSIMRAVFCETLATTLKNKVDTCDFFLVGFFSHIESFFGKDKHFLLSDLPIAPDIKGVLLDEICHGHLFNTISIAKSLEVGMWAEVDIFAKSSGIDSESIRKTYYRSARETQDIVEAYHC